MSFGIYENGVDLQSAPKMHFVVKQTVANSSSTMFIGLRQRGGVNCGLTTLDFDTGDFDELFNDYGTIVLNGSDIEACSALNFIHYHSTITQNARALFDAPDHTVTFTIPAEIRDRFAMFSPRHLQAVFQGSSINGGVLSSETRRLTILLEYVSSSQVNLTYRDTSNNLSGNRGVPDSSVQAFLDTASDIEIIFADLPNDIIDENGTDSTGFDCNGQPVTPTFLRYAGAVEYAEPDTAEITVEFSRILSNSLTFDWSAAGSGTTPATAGIDFAPSSGSESVAAGALSHTFNISILDSEAGIEPDETFTVTTSNYTGTNFINPATSPTVEITITPDPLGDYFNDYGRWTTSTGTIEATLFDHNGHNFSGFGERRMHRDTGTSVDPNGFKWNGIHGTTNTPFDSIGLTWDRKTAAQLNTAGWTAVSGTVDLSGTNGRYYTTSTGVVSSSYIGAETIIRGNLTSIGLGTTSGDSYSILAGATVYGDIGSTDSDINCYTTLDPAATREVGSTVFGNISNFSGDYSDYIGGNIPNSYSQGACLMGDLNGPDPSESAADPDVWDYAQIWGDVPNGFDVICTGSRIYGCVGKVLRQNPSFCPAPLSYVQQIGGC